MPDGDDGNRPLVIGAGPVGLAAALFLARRGLVPRVVEARGEPSPWSKALAVNPRTLELLEPTGVTARMLALGLKIRGAGLHRPGRPAIAVPFDGVHPTYPYMLALSQATTERLLAEAFVALGGRVERRVRLVDCRSLPEGAEATLAPADDDTAGHGGDNGKAADREVVRCPWLLAADGSRSTARDRLGIDFPGSSLADPWHLVDAPLRTALAQNRAHTFFLQGGAFLFLIRVVSDAKVEAGGEALWRVLGNRPDPLRQLAEAGPRLAADERAEAAGPPTWASTFAVAHRVAATLSAGHVHLAGDAAHVHSPVGARGMNLGLEDAWTFAALAAAGRLADYGRLRRPVDAAVVRRVEAMSRMAAGVSAATRLARRFVLPLAIRLPPARRRMRATITGLDHPLPDVGAGLDTGTPGGDGRRER